MNFEDYHVYVVEGEPAITKLAAFEEDAKLRREAASKWAEKYGGNAPLSRGQFLCGIVTKLKASPIGKGWKPMQHQPHWPAL